MEEAREGDEETVAAEAVSDAADEVVADEIVADDDVLYCSVTVEVAPHAARVSTERSATKDFCIEKE